MRTGTIFWKIFFAVWLGYILLLGATTVLLDIQYEARYNTLEVSERYRVFAEYIISQYESGADLTQEPYRQRRPGQGSADGEDLLAIQDLSTREVVFGDPNWTERENSVRWIIERPESGGRYIANVSIPRLRTPLPGLMSHTANGLRLAVALIFSWVLTMVLTRPIARLRTHVQQLGLGDLDQKLEGRLMRRSDEIGDLAKAIDEMSQRIQALLASKQRLLHDVSHELRAPLARLQVAAEIVRVEAENEGKDLSMHDRFEQEIETLKQLISELLLLARTENEEQARKELFLDRLLGDVVADMRFGAPERNIETRIECVDAVALGSEVLFERLVKNLIENSLKYSEGSVFVQLTDAGSDWLIQVFDEGEGVPEDYLDLIVQPFTRAQAESAEGFGLGLSIASRAAASMGGTLVLANRAQGGFAATVRLPKYSPKKGGDT